MPELPEVETIARGLRTGLEGARISRVITTRPDYVDSPPSFPPARLAGKTISAVTRHGKRLGLALAPRGELIFHLGMSGQITLQDARDPVALHTHVRITLGRGALELRVRDPRRFGGVWILPPGDDRTLRSAPGMLGPDALAIGLSEWRSVLARRRQIKALLLDQGAIAGLGNIYCDEALFAARIHPRALAAGLSDQRVRLLHREVRRILHSAIRHGGSTLRDFRRASGGRGEFQSRHRVYGREGEPCPRCGRRIRRILVAARSSHVCTNCQRLR